MTDGTPSPELERKTCARSRQLARQGGVELLSGHNGPARATRQDLRRRFADAEGRCPAPKEHFGYTDGIGDPVFQGQYARSTRRSARSAAARPTAPAPGGRSRPASSCSARPTRRRRSRARRCRSTSAATAPSWPIASCTRTSTRSDLVETTAQACSELWKRRRWRRRARPCIAKMVGPLERRRAADARADLCRLAGVQSALRRPAATISRAPRQERALKCWSTYGYREDPRRHACPSVRTCAAPIPRDMLDPRCGDADARRAWARRSPTAAASCAAACPTAHASAPRTRRAWHDHHGGLRQPVPPVRVRPAAMDQYGLDFEQPATTPAR